MIYRLLSSDLAKNHGNWRYPQKWPFHRVINNTCKFIIDNYILCWNIQGKLYWEHHYLSITYIIIICFYIYILKLTSIFVPQKDFLKFLVFYFFLIYFLRSFLFTACKCVSSFLMIKTKILVRRKTLSNKGQKLAHATLLNEDMVWKGLLWLEIRSLKLNLPYSKRVKIFQNHIKGEGSTFSC